MVVVATISDDKGDDALPLASKHLHRGAVLGQLRVLYVFQSGKFLVAGPHCMTRRALKAVCFI